MRTRVLATVIFALLAVPAAADASPRQIMSFEAPTQLLDDTQRETTMRQIRAFGVTHVRQIVYWRSFAPRPKRASASRASTRATRRRIRAAPGTGSTASSRARATTS